jgi:hypothetical protein
VRARLCFQGSVPREIRTAYKASSPLYASSPLRNHETFVSSFTSSCLVSVSASHASSALSRANRKSPQFYRAIEPFAADAAPAPAFVLSPPVPTPPPQQDETMVRARSREFRAELGRGPPVTPLRAGHSRHPL